MTPGVTDSVVDERTSGGDEENETWDDIYSSGRRWPQYFTDHRRSGSPTVGMWT
jgi:hypothetical protein